MAKNDSAFSTIHVIGLGPTQKKRRQNRATADMPDRIKLYNYRHISGANWISAEPVVMCIIELPDTPANLSGIDILNAVDRLPLLHPRLDWAPLVPLSKTASLTFADATARLSLYLLNEVRGCLSICSAIELPRKNCANIIVGAHNYNLTRQAIILAAECLIIALQKGESPEASDLAKKLDQFFLLCRSIHPDYQSRILILGAQQKGLSVAKISIGTNYWRVGSGKNSKIFRETVTQDDSVIASEITRDKQKTSDYLYTAGFPTPKQWVITSEDQLSKVWGESTGDIVIKPLDGGQGRGVTVRPKTLTEVMQAFYNAKKNTPTGQVVVQEFLAGNDFRILVLGGKVKAVTLRIPPQVVGDGRSTISDLVEKLNLKRSGYALTRRYLKQITKSPDIVRHLAQQELSWESIPAEGIRIDLRGNANISTGGLPVNFTDRVHEDVVRLAEQVATLFNVYALGIDYITTDIEKSPVETNGGIIEINTCPGMDVHAASGFTESELGADLIPDDTQDIFVAVFIATSDHFENDKNYWKSYLSESGHYIVANNELISPDKNSVFFTSPAEAVNACLLRKDCNKLLLVCRQDSFEESGLPINFCDFIFGVNLPALVASKIHLTAKNIRSNFYNFSNTEVPLGSFLSKAISLSEKINSQSTIDIHSPADRLKQFSVTLYDQVSRIEIKPGAVCLFVMVGNEVDLLPSFLAHYRQLGVDSFVIFDDQSDDGSAEFLRAQPDVHVVADKAINYGTVVQGVSFKHAVRELVPEVAADSCWWLVVDCDEFMVLPPGFDNLTALYHRLDKKKATCVFGTMVDFYPESLPAKIGNNEADLFKKYPYYDGGSRCRRLYEPYRVTKTAAGVRGRMLKEIRKIYPDDFEALLAGKGYIGPALNKVPIIKTGLGYRRPNAHVVCDNNGQLIVPPVDLEVLLAHFKFTSALAAKINNDERLKNYYLDGIEYKILDLSLKAFDGRSLLCSHSRLFQSAKSFYEDIFL